MLKNKTRIVPKKPTLKQIHNDLVNQSAFVRKEIGKAIGVTESTVFAIIRGDRICSPAEREAIAKIYGKNPSEINWIEK